MNETTSPARRRVKRYTTGIAQAVSTAWAMSRTLGLSHTQYNGANTAMIGWKWSPKML